MLLCYLQNVYERQNKQMDGQQDKQLKGSTSELIKVNK